MLRHPIVVSLLVCCAPSLTAALTFEVDRIDDEPSAMSCTTAPVDCSLRGAVQAAEVSPGADTIILPAETVSLTEGGGGGTEIGDLDISSELTIRGAGMSRTIITRGGGAFQRAFDLDDGGQLTLEDLTISGFGVPPGPGGGALRIGETDQPAAVLRGVRMTDNQALTGGAISLGSAGDPNEPVRLTIQDSLIDGNLASGQPGAPCSGGGLLLAAPAMIENTVIEDNQAPSGGGICARDFSLALTGVEFLSNRHGPGGAGGGLYSDGASVTGNRVHFQSNGINSGSGGALLANGGVLMLTGSQLSKNIARSSGVALIGDVDAQISDSDLLNNTPLNLLINDASVTLNDVALSGTGGGIGMTDAILTADQLTVSNHTSELGAGIWASNSLLFLDHCRFSGNEAITSLNSPSGLGGAIYMDGGGAEISRCTFDGNQAAAAGGAVALAGSLAIQFENSTFSGNAAPAGAVLHLANVGNASLSHVTIALPSATLGSGPVITLLNSDAQLENSAIEGSCELFFGGGSTTSNNQNQLTDSSCLATDATDSVVPDLLLLPLSGADDWTAVHLARADSPLLGAASMDCLPEDQRGMIRDTPCDVGAVEHLPGETRLLFVDGFESSGGPGSP